MSKILKECTVEGNIVKLPEGQLDRKEYMAVKKALELIGGKWKGGKVQGFVFPTDPTELLGQVAGGEKRNIKKEFQFFATPSKLAIKLVKLANLKHDSHVLEPSAGQGAIIEAINNMFPSVNVDAYELMDVNRDVLHKAKLDFTLQGGNFLEHKFIMYDAVIANPPFTKNQDIDHLKEMYGCLKDGGTLVCITSESWIDGIQKKQVAFRNWLYELNSVVIDIPRGSFKESGTMVGGRIVVIRK